MHQLGALRVLGQKREVLGQEKDAIKRNGRRIRGIKGVKNTGKGKGWVIFSLVRPSFSLKGWPSSPVVEGPSLSFEEMCGGSSYVFF